MSAGESLSPEQFTHVYKSGPSSSGERTIHTVEAHKADDPGRPVGYLDWKEVGGEISHINVDVEHRRKGVASGMYAAARAFADLHAISEPRHSNDRTPFGSMWARSVSPPEKIPPLG